MATAKARRRRVLRVVLDDDFQKELRQAGELTGIRGKSDLVRFAVRRLLKGDPARA